MELSPPQPNAQTASSPVTLMLTDIEGSTRLLEILGDDYASVVLRSRELLRTAVARHNGTELDAHGDAFFAGFRDPRSAVHAALDVQRSFFSERWPRDAQLRVRIGVHTGQPQQLGNSYFGLDVHRAARICAAAGGGQIVLSAITRDAIADHDLPPDATVRDLGSHRLKDLRYPELLFDIAVPGLPLPPTSLQSVTAAVHNLPLATTTFIGREQQLAEICALVAHPDTRLLTLTGPGGTGKTRLAVEAARQLLPLFPHGVFLVSLASVSQPDLVASTIVQTLDVPDFGQKSAIDSLTHHLAQRSTLLVLDNFEQIVAAATQLVPLLQSCARLKILVTSREPLNLLPEREYAVAPLHTPAASASRDVDALGMVESVRLFVARVQAYDRSFVLSDANAAAISAICRRLDGLPLALELAASWLRLFTPDVLLTRLEHSVDLLRGGPKDLPRHQQTLKDTIAWSYDLLTPREQSMFRRFSVFAGGCSIDAALTIASDGDSPDAITDLMSLVRKNLLHQNTTDGERRLGILETIRQFGTQRLEDTPEHDAVHQTHANHFLAVVEAAAPALTGSQQHRFVTPLLAEQDNIRAALDWAIGRRDATAVSRFLTGLVWLWIPRGQFNEGRAWAARACAAFANLGDAPERALILEAAGWLEALAGNYDDAEPLFEASHGILSTRTDPVARARAHVTLGVTYLVRGNERGVLLSDEAVRLADEAGEPSIMALALLSAGIKHQVTGNAAEAEQAYRHALQTFYQADNLFWPGQLLQNLAILRLQQGDPDAAAVLALDALRIGREYDYPMIRNLSMGVVGGIALVKGDALLATRLLGAVEASLRELGVRFEPPEHAFMQMNLETARGLLGEAVFDTALQEGGRWTERDVIAAVGSLHPLGGAAGASLTT